MNRDVLARKRKKDEKSIMYSRCLKIDKNFGDVGFEIAFRRGENT